MPPRPRPTRRPAVLASRLPSLALIAFGAATALPRAGAAQERRPALPWERQPRVTLSLAASGLYSNLSRSAVGHDGFGFDAGTYLGVGDFALGVGYQRVVHERRASRSGVYEGIFVEPRVLVPLGAPGFTPYLTGRLVRITPLFAPQASGEGRARGVQLGGGGGVLVALAPRVRLDLGGTYSRLRLDEGSAAVQPDERSSDVAQARVGLVFAVGGRR